MRFGTTNNTLRDSLLTEDPFAYAHLVKFERPLKTDSGKSARRAKDYSYITDGSVDIIFNDGSNDIKGNANGSQTYIANKLIRVGDVSETTEAKASSMNISVSAAALSTTLNDSFTFAATTITGTTDLVEEGFREGDIVEISGGTNSTAKVRIDTFSNSNLTANVTPLSKVNISTNKVEEISSLSSQSLTTNITFVSPEVEGVLVERSGVGYAKYINRDVFIYKAHINPDTGAQIGTPYLLFKGIIQSAKLQEDPEKSSIVQWTISSHWGDFNRVNGRLTSDAHHRALDGAGNPDLGAVIRPAYTTDLGFAHSEQAINLVSVYQSMETRYKEKRRGGLAGLFGGKKMVEYEVEVDNEVDLSFNLDAKYLPVIYGVAKVDSIPIFVDTLATDVSEIFVAYAICEGEVGGLYDIYIDDNSSVCLDENDFDVRNVQTAANTVDVVCKGRMHRGDTLDSKVVKTNTNTLLGGFGRGHGSFNWRQFLAENPQVQESIAANVANFPSATASADALGITHDKGAQFETPITADIEFYSGKRNQKASSILTSNAANFKVGQDYFSGSATNYWGPQHRLLDTAYAVAHYSIAEGEVTIPSLDFVVRGKGIECFDYDFSYQQDPAYSGADAASSAFNIGELVTLKRTSDNANITTTARIADIFQVTPMEGAAITRIRFEEDPGLGDVTAFYMVSGSNNYHFVTYNHIAQSGTVAQKLEETITAASANSGGSSADITVGSANSVTQKALDIGSAISIHEGNFSPNGEDFSIHETSNFEYTYSGSGTTITDVGKTATDVAELVNDKITIKDAIALAGSGISGTNDAYNNYFIEVTRILADNTTRVQTRQIVDYDGTTKVASVDAKWDEDAVPNTNDTYKIFSKNDVRVSINPAIQLLDYLRAKRYGRDLDLENDIHLESFQQAARDCDTRSEVTVVRSGGSDPAVGDYFEFAYNNKTLWYGKLKSVSSTNLVFENVSGKLAHRWENWKYFYAGELYYYQGALHQASSNGIVSSTPSTTSSYPSSGSLTLTKIGTGGVTSIALETAKANNYADNPVVKTRDSATSYSSGYNIYDSDDVKYWRYVGWEAQNQRHVTRHQTNTVINTKTSVFSNVNSMLGHFNGILRYSNGLYSLAVKKKAFPPTPVNVGGVNYTVEDITQDDIIGSISIEDGGAKGTYNSISIGIPDPQNKFESRSVTLFNSTYLKQDRMVPKKGDLKTPYVSNYFNARVNAKQYLDDSRANIKINFTMGPKGVLLRAGDIIRLTYDRFGWTNKLYRIKNLSFKENCLVQVTAEEHNDDGYIIPPSAPILINPVEGIAANLAVPTAPSNLQASTNERGGVTLTWTNSTKFDPATYTVQIFRHTSDAINSATQIATSTSNTHIDNVTGDGQTTLYYWIKYAVKRPSQRTSGVALKEVFSAFHPTTNGVVGVSDGAVDGLTVTISNENASVVGDASGNVSSFADTGTTIQVAQGGTQLTFDNSSPFANSTFRVTASTPSGVTAGASSTTSNSFSLANITAMPGDTGKITFTIIAKDSLGRETTFTRVQNFTKTKRGVDGVSGLSVAELVLYYEFNTYGGSQPSTPSTGVYNFSTGVIASIPSGWSQTRPSTRIGYLVYKSSALATEASAAAGVSGSLSWSSVSLGDRGIGDVNFIFKYSSSQPTTPSATSISTSSGIPTGWSDSPPTNPNDGSKLWSSKGKAALSGSLGAGFSFNYTWETPVVHVQAKSDVGLASAEDKSSQDIRNEIVEADLVGSGNAFSVKPNKIELDDFVSEEGRLRFKTDGGSFVNLDPFSSSARIAVNNVRQGIDPVAGSGTIRNSDITMNVGGYLNNIGTTEGVRNDFIQLNTDGTLNYSNSGSGNPTMNTLTDAGNIRSRLIAGLNTDGDVDRAVPVAKGGTSQTNTNTFLNSNISISSPAAGTIRIGRGAYSNIDLSSINNSFVGLGNVANAAQVRADLVGAPGAILNSSISLTKQGTAARLSGTGVTTQDVTFAKGDVGLGNVPNTDATNATNISSGSLSTARGGTGQTNTARFLNNSIGISTSGNAISIARGGGYSTVSITGLAQGLVGLSGVSNNADVTSSNTSADTAAVGGTAAATVRNGAASGATANQDSTSTIRGGITINANGTLSGAGGGQVTTSGIGAETPTGAQNRVDGRLSSTEKNRLNAGTSPDNTKTFNNASISISSAGVLSGAGGGTVTASGLGANTDSTATIRAGVTKANVGLGSVDNLSAASIRSGTTKANVGLGNVANVDTTNASNISSGTLPAGRGGTGISNFSNSTHLNANTTKSQVGLGNVDNVSASSIRSGTTTFSTDKATSVFWSNLAGNMTPSFTTYDVTITWRDGNQSSLGTTVIRVSRGTTSLNAASTQSNSAGASVSLGSAASSGSTQTTTVTKNSVVVKVTGFIINGSNWSFK